MKDYRIDAVRLLSIAWLVYFHIPLEAEAVNYKLFSTNHSLTYRIFFSSLVDLNLFNVDSDLDPALQVKVFVN